MIYSEFFLIKIMSFVTDTMEPQHVFGFPAVPRTQKDLYDKGVVIPNPYERLPWSRGLVVSWHFYIQATTPVDIALQVNVLGHKEN